MAGRASCEAMFGVDHQLATLGIGPTIEPSSVLARLLDEALSLIDADQARAKDRLRRAAQLLASVRGGGEACGGRDGHVFAPWRAKQIRDFIDANIEGPIRVGEMAERAELSASFFSRAFYGSFGMSPHAYIINRRIVLAQEMLLTTNERLAQIAIACGFSDQAHFSKLFRRKTGQTPGAWRRERRGVMASLA
jgi:AraC family transcriptional regulator